MLLALASGVAYAGVVVTLRALRGLDPLWLSGFANLAGAATLALWLFATGPGLARPTSGQAVILVAFGVVQMAIPYALFARGLRDVTAAEAGLISLLEPVLTPIWVVLFHGETPTRATIVGGAIPALRRRPPLLAHGACGATASGLIRPSGSRLGSFRRGLGTSPCADRTRACRFGAASCGFVSPSSGRRPPDQSRLTSPRRPAGRRTAPA